MYSFLADLVMLLHFSFILLVVFGGLLALRWQRFAVVHLPAVLWALFLELKPGTLCPLTPLEQMLRHRAGEPSYTGGFVGICWTLPRSHHLSKYDTSGPIFHSCGTVFVHPGDLLESVQEMAQDPPVSRIAQ
jgi:hypothetical protein